MVLDRQTREAVAATVKKSIAEAMLTYQEEWLNGEQLCEQFPMFSKEWLRRYGSKVPRERLEVFDREADKTIGSRWMYPKHGIQKWIQERGHKKITI